MCGVLVASRPIRSASRTELPHRLDTSHNVAASVSLIRFADVSQRFRITQDVDRLLKLGQVLRADQHDWSAEPEAAAGLREPGLTGFVVGHRPADRGPELRSVVGMCEMGEFVHE